MIEIILNPVNSKFSNILLSIDNISATYIVNENKIVIDQSIDLGIHILRLQLLDDHSKIDIADVTVNGSSLRQTLFFSFIEQGSDRLQPATCVWDSSQIWVLPFMNPVSQWIGLLGEKLRKDALGSDLNLDYKIYIPESVQLPDNFPSAVVDFFKFNFDCTILHKDNITAMNLPYEKYTEKLDTQGVYDEIYKNLDLIRATVPYRHGQTIYNERDDKNYDFNTGWFATTIYGFSPSNKHCHIADSTMLPLTYALVNSLDLDPHSIAVSVSPPGTYAYTHIDKRKFNPEDKFNGCKQLYIPLNYPAGAMVKFRNVGILPKIPMINNPQYYSHAVVNNSNETRIVLSVTYDYRHNI